MDENPLLAIAIAFIPLSLVTIGGGQSAVADIHRQVVDLHHWLGEAELLDDHAISRLAAVWVLLLAPGGGWLARAVALASTVLLMRSRINPLLLIGGGSALFVGLRALGL